MRIDLYLFRQAGAQGAATHCSKGTGPHPGFEALGVAETGRAFGGLTVVVDCNCPRVRPLTSLDRQDQIEFS
ncbi:hypothetical protein UFOVP1326_23 [uncultured Caudovirales phage]|uniref:Uncharacterized protein n=1 Tax=uncultured Caudovirales phage TaxID=2100421 RepID=A0A6J5RZ82_9CAUD|nr:hypothetical protein UFOVP1326_23 [uncultured Caudovirales phage]CAB4212512.1 hypothetical protein UFOVP1436_16 [uncultured Caudovirales phage]